MNKMTQTAAIAAIGAASRELHLPTVRAEAERLAEVAERSRTAHLAYLADVLAAEIDDRAERRRDRRIHEARFPRIKRLGRLRRVGRPGRRRDHRLVGIGDLPRQGRARGPARGLRHRQEPSAHRHGHGGLRAGPGRALCRRAPGLVNELVEAADERRLSRLVSRYGRLDLLLLDELGYVQLDARGAELLFQILTEREEKSSVAMASNLPFSEWGQVIDRSTPGRRHRRPHDVQRAHIIETGTESFRLRSTGRERPRKLFSGPSGGPCWRPPD